MKMIFSLICALVIGSQANAVAVVDPALENFANGQNLEKFAKVIVELEVPKNNLQIPYRYQRQAVIQYLQGLTVVATQNLQAVAFSTGASQQDIQIREVFWINLSLSAVVTKEGLKELAKAPGVMAIYSNKKIIYPRALVLTNETPNQTPYQWVQTGLDKVIAEMPKIDGTGMFVGHIDTGVDANHPALKGKVALFFDGKKVGPPSDSASHGTHTAGTILGGDRTGVLIGVAPGAKLISAGFLRDLDEILRGMQWMLDPDGNPQTNDSPKMVSNSWRVWHDSTMPVDALYRAVSSWEAAGIVPVFAGGNEGPNPKTLGHPSMHIRTVCVAATDQAGKVAGFSSRGPGIYEGKEIQKPDIAAPGVDVVSSVPGGGFSKMSGTSMATPQVAGAIALLLQANQRLTPPQIAEILIKSAVPGEGQQALKWDPNFGYGKMNIYQALKLAIGAGQPVAPLENFMISLIDPMNSARAEKVSVEPTQIPFTWEDMHWADAWGVDSL